MTYLSKRRISPCLFWYMARQFALPFVCTLIAFMAIFLLNDVFNDLGTCFENHVTFYRSVVFFLAKQPHNLVNVVPISALLASSFMTIMLGRNNELTAMRAAGLSLAQCALPVWLLSILAALLVFAVNESWGPKCSRISHEIEMHDMYQQDFFKRLTFHHPSKRRDWSIESAMDDGSFSKVIIRQYTENGSTDYLLVASRGVYGNGKWTFFDGFRQSFSKDDRNSVSQDFFETLETDFTESPSDIDTHSNRPENMSIAELYSVLSSHIVAAARSRNMMKALIWNRLTLPLITIMASLFGVALTISTDRKSAVKGFACSIALLVCAMLFSQLCLIFAQNGNLPPFIGGALPNLSFLTGAILLMRARR